MNLPNKLTLGRLIAIPAIMACLSCDSAAARWGAFVLFVAACVTDFFDGRIARARNLITNLGKFMDPLADKALVSTVLCYFIRTGFAHPAAVVIVLIREFVVSGIRMAAVTQGRVVAANIFGKIKTAFQMVSLSFILFVCALAPEAGWLSAASNVCVWIIAALTAASGVIYVVQNRDVLKED